MLSGILTLLLMLLFLGVWAWSWQPRHRARFVDAARLALDDAGTDDDAADATPAHIRKPRA
jgi:cytochrome c oxidase cbb3-type subunit 4